MSPDPTPSPTPKEIDAVGWAVLTETDWQPDRNGAAAYRQSDIAGKYMPLLFAEFGRLKQKLAAAEQVSDDLRRHLTSEVAALNMVIGERAAAETQAARYREVVDLLGLAFEANRIHDEDEVESQEAWYAVYRAYTAMSEEAR